MLICLQNRLFGFAVQRYNKICGCARKWRKNRYFLDNGRPKGYGTAFRLLEIGRYYHGTPILIYRVSNVYLTYIYRISTVVYSGKT